MSRLPIFWVLVVSLLALPESHAHAQAYCSLRDPASTLQESFPDFDHYRSIVRNILPEHRQRIHEILPFTIHPYELGTHTLYVAFDSGNDLLGVVHVRTERGNWGLTEIAWLLDPDLRVVGMKFQRVRDRNQEYIESASFQGQVRGKGFHELRGLLNADGTRLAEGGLEVPKDARPLAVSVIRSSLKTILASSIVWKDALEQVGWPGGLLLSPKTTEDRR